MTHMAVGFVKCGTQVFECSFRGAEKVGWIDL